MTSLALGALLGGFGGSRGSGNPMPNFFDGRDPFDDPFFTQPFGSMFGPGMFGSSMLGRDMFGSSILGRDMFGSSMLGPGVFGSRVQGPSMFGSERSFFTEPSNAGFIEQHVPSTVPSTGTSGPIIEEILSDEEEQEEDGGMNDAQKKDKTRKHLRQGNEPDKESEVVEAVDYAEKKSKFMQDGSNSSMAKMSAPQAHTYSFHSSTVTYGGANGAYYTSSTTRKTGGDGVTLEESKEADTTTGRATHRVSRGIHEKGHSVTRKLNEGRVETMQTLHNLNENELPEFEKSWKRSPREHLPHWNQNMGILDYEMNTNNEMIKYGWLRLQARRMHPYCYCRRQQQHCCHRACCNIIAALLAVTQAPNDSFKCPRGIHLQEMVPMPGRNLHPEDGLFFLQSSSVEM